MGGEPEAAPDGACGTDAGSGVEAGAVPRRFGGGWWRAWAAPTVGVLLSVVLVTWALRLWEADLFVPFGYNLDALLNDLWVKTLIDTGWYLHNDSVGAPAGLDMHDFPLFDSLFFVILKLIGLVTRNFALTINLYFLLTFPLTTLTALLALRRLGVSSGPGLVAALLFAFQPYHFLRQQHHLFLASYFLIPPMVVVLLRIYTGGGERGREPGRWGGPVRVGWGAVTVCLLMSCGGIYYAFFSCYLLLVAGLGASLRRRCVGPLARSGLLIGVIVLGVLANATPKLLYVLQHGRNPEAVRRTAFEAEFYGLRVVQMVLPIASHRLEALSRLTTEFHRVFPNSSCETLFAVLGLTGSVGFVLLLGRLLASGARPGSLDGLALLNMAAVVLGVSGGLGTVFSFLVSPSIRAYNRISIFIACFALFALALLAERLRARLTRPLPALAFHGALGLVLAGGIWDQIVPSYVPPYARLNQTFASDAEFVGRIEAALPRRALVFQLPSVGFPETPDSFGMSCYDQFRFYLHSRELRWSHGVMKGRPGDRWRSWVYGQPLDQMVATLAYAGFDGIQIDREGYYDRATEVEAFLTRLLGAGPEVVSRDGTQSFFTLGAYATRLRSQHSVAEWERLRDEALYPVTVSWGLGFFPEEWRPPTRLHWSKRTSELTLFNPSSRPRRVAVVMRCVAGVPGPALLRVHCRRWRSKVDLADGAREVRHELVLPHGATVIRLAYGGPRGAARLDPWAPIFRVEDLAVSLLTMPASAATVARGDAGEPRR